MVPIPPRKCVSARSEMPVGRRTSPSEERTRHGTEATQNPCQPTRSVARPSFIICRAVEKTILPHRTVNRSCEDRTMACAQPSLASIRPALRLLKFSGTGRGNELGVLNFPSGVADRVQLTPTTGRIVCNVYPGTIRPIDVPSVPIETCAPEFFGDVEFFPNCAK